MSIRKVSDLETAYIADGSMSLSDVEDSLLEFSVPNHSDDGHSFKSMKAKYADVRTDIMSAILSSGGTTTFTTCVDFLSTANFYAGANISGDLCVNVDNPGWQDTTVYIRAGDITLYGDNSVNIYSNDAINLSAPSIYAYSDTFYIKGFSDPTVDIVSFGKSGSSLHSQLTTDSAIRIPTTTGVNGHDAVNVNYLTDYGESIKQEIINYFENDDDDDDNGVMKLVSMRMYGPGDYPNVQYMFEKVYSVSLTYTNSNGEEETADDTFIEYDIRSTGKIEDNNYFLELPNAFQLSGMHIITDTAKKNGGTYTTYKKNVQLCSLNPKDSDLSGIINGLGLKNVGNNCVMNAHILAPVANLDNLSKLKVLIEYKFNQSPLLDKNLYTFSTPLFSLTTNGTKYTNLYIKINGFAHIVDANGDDTTTGNCKVQACLVGYTDDVDQSNQGHRIPLFSGMDECPEMTSYYSGGYDSAAYPFHERLRPQYIKSKGQYVDIPQHGSVDVNKAAICVSQANNGYYSKANSSNIKR